MPDGYEERSSAEQREPEPERGSSMSASVQVETARRECDGRWNRSAARVPGTLRANARSSGVTLFGEVVAEAPR